VILYEILAFEHNILSCLVCVSVHHIYICTYIVFNSFSSRRHQTLLLLFDSIHGSYIICYLLSRAAAYIQN
jgi:hypothetical protein